MRSDEGSRPSACAKLVSVPGVWGPADVLRPQLLDPPSAVLEELATEGVLAASEAAGVVLALVLADDALPPPHEVTLRQPLSRGIPHRRVHLGLGEAGVDEHQPGSALHG